MKQALSVLLRTLSLLMLARCATEGSDSGSQTHWLAPCRTSSECSAGLGCKCGVCTRSCEEGAECGDLGRNATCFASGSSPTLELCGAGEDTSLCLPTCGPGCASNEICVDGACVVPQQPAGDSGAGKDGNGGPSRDARAESGPPSSGAEAGTTAEDDASLACAASLVPSNPLGLCFPLGVQGVLTGSWTVTGVEQREVCGSDGTPLQGYRFTAKGENAGVDGGTGPWVFEVAPGFSFPSGHSPILNPAPFVVGERVSANVSEPFGVGLDRATVTFLDGSRQPVLYVTHVLDPAASSPIHVTRGDVFCTTQDRCGAVHHHFLNIEFAGGTGSEGPGGTMGDQDWLVYNRSVTTVVSNGSCSEVDSIHFEVIAIRQP